MNGPIEVEMERTKKSRDRTKSKYTNSDANASTYNVPATMQKKYEGRGNPKYNNNKNRKI